MDNRFIKNLGPFNIAFIAEKIEANIVRPKKSEYNDPKNISIKSVNSLENAAEGELSFLSNLRYEEQLLSAKSTACIVSPAIAEKYQFDNLWLLVHPNPYFAYANALDLFYEPIVQYKNHIEDTAFVHSKSIIGKNIYIGYNVVISEGAEIGDGTFIGSGTYIGPGVKIGNNTRIDSNASISYAVVGNNVVILPGARIGQDGFGFATEKGKHKKIFHIGTVIIEDDVEIGANCTIDRGALNNTVIKRGARLDNLVQIGHNVEIGIGSVLVSQVGIAGSTVVGNYCAFGGQAGAAGHIKIADKAQIAGQAGVQHSIKEAGVYFGTPALPIREWQRQNIAIKKLASGTNK